MKLFLSALVFLTVGIFSYFVVKNGAASRGAIAPVPAALPTIARAEQPGAPEQLEGKQGARTLVGSSQQTSYASSSVYFSDAKRCHQAASNVRDWQVQLDICKDATGSATVDRCKTTVPGLTADLKGATQILSSCSPVPAEIREDFFKASRDAAKEGDRSAQLCYLNSDFDLHRPFSSSEVDDFKATAQSYAEEGLANGDWRMVQLMGLSARAFPRHYSLRSLLSDGQPFTVYKMNRLLRLGADDTYGDALDLLANIPRQDLSPQEISDADAWANAEFSKYFSSSPKLSEPPTICESR